MIFLTVGTQEPFDRLVRLVDEWAALNPERKIFGQLGKLGASSYRPCHFDYVELLPSQDFAQKLKQSEMVISHAGMGTIINSVRSNKQLLLLARRASLGEHRNEHQLATIRHLQRFENVFATDDEQEFRKWLDEPITPLSHNALSPFASPSLIAAIKCEIWKR